jgi:hypothetical protein
MTTQPHATESSQGSQPANAPIFRLVDLPELAETFADSIETTLFDGQSLRINFCVTRLDGVPSATAPTGRRYPICRLVLTPAAAVDLINRMQNVTAALIKAGILKPTPIQGATLPGN